jgi:hypothetical protein
MDQLSREREEVTGREEIDKLAKQLRQVPSTLESSDFDIILTTQYASCVFGLAMKS